MQDKIFTTILLISILTLTPTMGLACCWEPPEFDPPEFIPPEIPEPPEFDPQEIPEPLYCLLCCQCCSCWKC